MERIKALWLCNSGVGQSETFLMDSINLLSSDFELSVVCGATSARAMDGFYYGGFGSIPLRKRHTLVKKAFGFDRHLQLQQRKCVGDVMKVLGGDRPNFVWLEFGTTAWIAKEILEALAVPYFINVHGYDITSAFKSDSYREGFVELANKSSAVICASNHTKMLCQLAGIDTDRLRVIRYAIDEARFPELQLKTSHPSFVHFGRLTDKKGPLITLEAFALVVAEHPQAQLTFVGDGPLLSQLKERIGNYGLEDSVQVLPGMDWNDGMTLVSRHWVYCQHSVTALDGDQEGFALSPAEAAVLGLPVVSTWHNGIPEHVLHGETGLLSREHDFETMARHMRELIEDESMRQEMGRKGRENILRMCNPSTRHQILVDLIQSCL